MKHLGPYELISRISSGGMGEIYLARLQREGGFEKHVAVKRILPHLAQDRGFIQMFETEARLTALLNHRNIVHVYDFGRDGNEVWLSMEYVDGVDLRKVIDFQESRGIPPGLALYIAAQCARALDYAHRCKGPDGQELQIIHRDISPQNILVSFEGEVKLTDFGLAKACNFDTWSMSGMLKGKLAYMAPEQVVGGPLDARSDIFSLGLVLYEMLSAKRCYPPNTPIAQLMDFASKGQFDSLEDVAPGLGQPVYDLLDQCLAFDPTDRPQSAQALERTIHATAKVLGCEEPTYSLSAYLRPLAEEREHQKQTEALKTEVAPQPITSRADTVTHIDDADVTRAVRRRTQDLTASDLENINVAEIPRRRSRAWLALGAVAVATTALAWWLMLENRNVAVPEPSAEAVVAHARRPASADRRSRAPVEIDPKAVLIFEGAPKGARCFVKGLLSERQQSVAQSCAQQIRLSPGPYKVVATASGFLPWTLEAMEIKAGETHRTTVEMKRKPIDPCNFTVTTRPAGASVTLDAKPVGGKTPLELKGVTPGAHKLVISKGGHKSIESPLTCSRDADTALNYQLVEQRYVVQIGRTRKTVRVGQSVAKSVKFGDARVTVRVSARGSGGSAKIGAHPFVTVYLNGSRRGETPKTVRFGAGKTHKLSFRRNNKTVGTLQVRVSRDR